MRDHPFINWYSIIIVVVRIGIEHTENMLGFKYKICVSILVHW